MMTKDPIIAVRQELTALGYLEDSGERRLDRCGVTQPVWRVSTLGHIADVYLRQGFTLEEAMRMAKSAHVSRRS